MTLAPSSSTSLLTSRSRSGFDLSVCTPCAVRLERRMYVAITPPPGRGARLYSRSLVEVQQRAAEEEERRQDEIGEEERRPFRRICRAVQEHDQREFRDGEDDRQCRERPERVDVVGPRELDAASQRGTGSEALVDTGGTREPHEREPRDGGQDVHEHEQRYREDEKGAEGKRQRPRPTSNEQAGAYEGRAERRRRDREDDRLRRDAMACGDLVDERDRQAEGQAAPERSGVHPHRLRHELPDGTRLGRERRRL